MPTKQTKNNVVNKEKIDKIITTLELYGNDLKRLDKSKYQKYKNQLDDYLSLINRGSSEQESSKSKKQPLKKKQSKKEKVVSSEEDDVLSEEDDVSSKEDDISSEEEQIEIKRSEMKSSPRIDKKIKIEIKPNQSKNLEENKEVTSQTNVPSQQEGKNPFECSICGGKFTPKTKSKHLKSQKHLIADAKCHGYYDYHTKKILTPQEIHENKVKSI
jgi:hypothetical protein